MAGTSDEGRSPPQAPLDAPAPVDGEAGVPPPTALDAPYPVDDGVVLAHPGRSGRLPGRGAAGWVNDLAVTAWAYEPLWRHRSVSILTMGAASTAFELRTLRAWLAATLGAAEGGGAALAGRRVLDVGCSAGLYARTLAADGADVVALDASLAFLRAGRRRADRDGVSATWVHADAHALPLADASFDAAVVGATLNEFGDPARAFAEMGRVVRTGGLVWTMYARRAAGPARGLQWLLERGGLRFPAPEAVDAWAAAAGLSPLRRAEHGPVAFAIYRKGGGAPPLSVSSPSPGWEAGPASAARNDAPDAARGAPAGGHSSAT